jgi:endonuclease/exonuclease/phosphatase family metal-dependent hydrolase
MKRFTICGAIVIACTLAAVAILAGRTATAADDAGTFRVMTYNILAGGETNAGGVENRGELIREVIDRFDPDVLGLNEANNWHHDNAELLRRYGKQLGMTGILPIKHGGGVAAFVRQGIPILQVLTDTERQGHGLAIVTIDAPDGKPLKVFVTHMMHTNPGTRMRELKEIVRYIEPGDRCIVMGDLNSLSHRDALSLEDVPEGQRNRFTADGEIHTGVLEGLEDAGLIDVYRRLHPEQGEHDNTVGTKTSTDPAHAKAKLRLDYVLVTENLIDNVKSIEIVQTEETNRASDHFPIVMNMAF